MNKKFIILIIILCVFILIYSFIFNHLTPGSCQERYGEISFVNKTISSKEGAFLELSKYLLETNTTVLSDEEIKLNNMKFVEIDAYTLDRETGLRNIPLKIMAWVLAGQVSVDSKGTIYERIGCI